MARPAEFGPEILVKTAEYLKECNDSWYKQDKTVSKDSLTVDNKLKVKLPTKEGLSLYLCVSRETIYNWRDKYPQFAELMDVLNSMQADRLIQNGLSGDYNPTIAKVLLGIHGYVERTSNDTNVKIDTLTEGDKKRLLKFIK